MTQPEYEQKKLEFKKKMLAELFKTKKALVNYENAIFDYTFDRAFALGKEAAQLLNNPKQLNAEETVISGWVARDKSGYLVLHYKKPHRTLGNAKWYSAQSQKSLPRDSFPDLTWDDDPEPVEIIIKRKKE